MGSWEASLDHWLTTPPEPPPTFCPKCGKSSEDVEELDVIGLDGYGLLKYRLRVQRRELGLDGDPDKLVYIGGAGRAKEFATHVTLYRCECGAVLSEDGFVEAECDIPDDYLGAPREDE